MAWSGLMPVLLVAGAAQAGTAPPVSPPVVARDVAARGAKVVVEAMAAAGTWNQVEDGVAAGSRAWIRLVPSLAEGTDAGTAEGLGDSLTKALPKAPAAVLGVIDVSARSVPRSPEAVCSASFYEGDPISVAKYRARAIAAVNGVGDPRLAAAKTACLAHLRASHP